MNVPAEVLLNIAQFFYDDSGPSNFLNCLLVCRGWHDILKHMLYRDVVLRDRNLSNIKNFPVLHLPLIQSLTIGIAQRNIDNLPPDVLERTGLEDEETFSSPFAELLEIWNGLRILTQLLPKMDNLSTFSLVMDLPKTHIPRPLLAAILRALPQSCVSVDINTDGLDDCQNRLKNVHLCVEFRKLLPRLHHLRLQVAMVCCKFLSDSDQQSVDGSETSGDIIQDIAPNLRSLVIHYPRQQHRVRAHINNSIHRLQSNCDTWSGRPLVQRLRSLFEHSAFPQIQQLVVVDDELYDHLNRTVGHRVKYVRNIIENNTWAIPIVKITPGDAFVPVMARLPNNTEIIGPLQHLDYAIEGNLWIEISFGSNFPAEVVMHARKGNAAPVEIHRYETRDCQPFISREPKVHNTWNAPKIWAFEMDHKRSFLSAMQFEGIEDTPPIYTLYI